ncbi:flavin reductase family protein [Leucobacter weissii]|uniref:Flavin reductase family protein n=1 Tax=Leucobacter weissii TaxID=1983706 RepID=A0A939MNX0_9MICO|nr:flavin reductase family protein [Leucobacter weissii]
MSAGAGGDVANAFRTAFRGHPAGIALITARGADGGPVGLTASSVASVSVDPAALAFSVTRATGSAGALLAADALLVHLLDSRHIGLAQQFARSGGERFTPEQGWRTLETGEPYLPGVRAALRCAPLQITPVGESSAVIAEVLEVLPGETGAPLVYVDRAFQSLAGDADRPGSAPHSEPQPKGHLR